MRKFSWERHSLRFWVIQAKSHFEMGLRCVTRKGKKTECKVVLGGTWGMQNISRGCWSGWQSPFHLLSFFPGILSFFPAPVLEPVSPPHGQQPCPSHVFSLRSICWAAAKWERKGTTLYQRETLNGAWTGSKKVAPWGKHSFVVFRGHVVRTFCSPNSYRQAGEKLLWLE